MEERYNIMSRLRIYISYVDKNVDIDSIINKSDLNNIAFKVGIMEEEWNDDLNHYKPQLKLLLERLIKEGVLESDDSNYEKYNLLSFILNNHGLTIYEYVEGMEMDEVMLINVASETLDLEYASKSNNQKAGNIENIIMKRLYNQAKLDKEKKVVTYLDKLKLLKKLIL